MGERTFKARVTLWWAVVLFAGFAAVGVWMVGDGAAAGWLVTLGSLAFVLLGLSPLFTGRPRLRLTAEGFEVANLLGTRFVRWSEVQEWAVFTLQSNRMIGYTLRGQPNRTERQWTGFDGSIHNAGYTKTNEELLEILRDWKARHDAEADGLLLQRLAELGEEDLEGRFQLALKLANAEQALELLRDLAARGHTGAQLELGLALGGEEGLPWMRLAAEQEGEKAEETRAMLSAMLLDTADGPHGPDPGSPRVAEALAILRQQAERGSPRMQVLLGHVLSRLSERDPALAQEARTWLARAKDSEFAEEARVEANRLALPGWLRSLWGWPAATYGLLALIVGVFVLQWVYEGPDPGVRFLFWAGANNPLALREGEVWRLLTATILHGSLPHIGFNAFALWQIGTQLERVAGSAATLTAFVVSGLAGSLLSGLLGSPQVVSVGASGGVFGLIAFLIVYGVKNTGEFAQRLRTQGWLLAVYFLMSAFIPNVDNWGHLGGIAGGLLLGLFYERLPPGVRLTLGVASGLALVWALWRVATLM